MQKHKVAPQLKPIVMAIASALAANQELAMAVTCTANSDATLRACITKAANGDIISVATDITLSSFLPDITKNVTVQGNNRRISGNNAHRVFWVESGNVAIQNLTIANGLAQGGSGGGGGAGLGGGLFVNSGTVTLSNLTFTQNAAKGGLGDADIGTGGGGMGGNGTSNGGGGRLPGDNGSTYGVFGGGGVGGFVNSSGGFGGFGGGGGNGGFIYRGLSNGGSGGSGGFGGGGGAGFGSYYYSGYYGGYTIYGQGGFGGFGAGNGDYGKSGGGLGSGAAIFAKTGALTLKKVAFTQNSNSGGSGGNAGQGKATLFICTSTEDASCTATVTANSCGVTFSGNTAANAGTTDTDNADTFKVSRTNLMKSCVVPPIAVTNAPSVITTTNARLSGTVNPNGAAATASFNFGPTTTYGTNIAATPATIAATAAATNVSADKPGLTCGKTYHYRVKAVNNAGTTVGTDKAFTTSACTTNKVDLIITNAVLTPASPVANGTFTATVTVKNQGTVTGDGKFLDVWSNQPTDQVCGAVGNKRLAVGVIAAGASKTSTVTGVPAGTAGMKTLRAFVDSSCGTAETNETNNQRTVVYSVNQATRIDFVVTNVTLNPTAPSANGTFTATVTVKNQGNVAGDGKFLDVWSNQPTDQVCGAVGNKRLAVGVVAAGASKTLTVTGLPAGTAGMKTLRAFVDSGCGTKETNEGNNQLVKTFTVFVLTSVLTSTGTDTFGFGRAIPSIYTCDSQNISPELTWANPPANTQAFVMLLTDFNAPVGSNALWVLYNIPQNISKLARNVPIGATTTLPAANGARAFQAWNDFDVQGYSGPCPPAGGGPRQYVFRLIALNGNITGLTPTPTYAEIITAMQGKVLGSAELNGTYERQTGGVGAFKLSSPAFADNGILPVQYRSSGFKFIRYKVVGCGTAEDPAFCVKYDDNDDNAENIAAANTFLNETEWEDDDSNNIEGENISPPLNWDNVPDGTKSLVLILKNEEAAESNQSSYWTGNTHWIVYDIPPELSGLDEDVAKIAYTGGFYQGKNEAPWAVGFHSTVNVNDVLQELQAPQGTQPTEIPGANIAYADFEGAYAAMKAHYKLAYYNGYWGPFLPSVLPTTTPSNNYVFTLIALSKKLEIYPYDIPVKYETFYQYLIDKMLGSIIGTAELLRVRIPAP